MALFSHTFFSSFHSPVAQNTTPKATNSNLNILTPMITPQKWSISHENRLLSTDSPKSRDNYLSKYPMYNDDIYFLHEQKLNMFRQVLSRVGEDPFEGLKMIDAVQRLGIDYSFREEIDSILEDHYNKILNIAEGVGDHDLHEISLRFRLLRQQGYFVPADIFENFKDIRGLSNEKIRKKVKGLMELYEASHLCIEGEDLLDEAQKISSQLLASSLAHLNPRQARFVTNTLGNPHHKSIAKFTANRYFCGEEQNANQWINILQEVAKAESNIVQSLHQKEIVQVSNWWKELGLSKELTFARDQPLKWYIWSMACLTDPSSSQQRVELTKPISFIYVIDDIFDVYGTLEELTRFTEAVNRWEITDADKLPDYMKICFKALDNLTNEISFKIYQSHGWNPRNSLRKAWATLCGAFLLEAKWFASGHVPKTEEYLENGLVSSGVHVVLVHIFFLLGKGINKDTVEFVDGMPGIISSTATILRLWDDLGSAKDENQEGHDGSYVDCYVKEHQGSSIEEAREDVMRKISDAWKCLNKECLSPNPLSPAFVEASLNLARMVPMMYSYDENQRLPSLEHHVKSMLNQCFAN